MKKALLVLVLLAVVLTGWAAVAMLWREEDPGYRLQELVRGRYHRYDDMIRQAASRYGVPPELIKAVIWRESRFDPRKVGGQGERGLMQITEPAAQDWASAEKIETFVPADLFDPKVNIEAGTWYLARALERWKDKDDPVPFALAEYNAGRTRVRRWVRESGRGEDAGAGDLHGAMDFPQTKAYIASIMARRDYFVRRGEFKF